MIEASVAVWAGGVFAASIAIFLHHHLIYPALLRLLAGRPRDAAPPAPIADADAPSLTVLTPCHNEEAVIAEKIRNLAAIDYPTDRLEILLILDGCSDATEARARAALAELGDPAHIRLDARPVNRGKIAVLNDGIAAARGEIVALNDASALIEPDALRRLAAHFADPSVGVVCPAYRLAEAADAGEAAYWRYQSRLRAAEGALGGPMGAHGALYLIRRGFWEPLPADAINDDFLLPMGIVASGAKMVYEPGVASLEAARTRPGQDFRRRLRLGAGAMQQALRLWRLADPRRPAIAFMFLSGKGLRPFIPFVILLGAAACATLAALGAPVFQALALGGAALAALAVLAARGVAFSSVKPLRAIGYFLEGYWASGLGAARWLVSRHDAWGARREEGEAERPQGDEDFTPISVRVSKRALDIVVASGVLAAYSLVFPFIALAVKLDSKGPIFYRQMRVGRRTAQMTHLFYICKIRTMTVDAEAKSGAVWAKKNDNRITRVGKFLRQTRLDELPQAWNVLRGDMSFIGPRPERPKFFITLEERIPFYSERTYGVKPGLTGLAQVSRGYDESIEDVNDKVLYDHAYAAQLTRWIDWLKTDVSILARTVGVVLARAGQ